MPSTLFFVGNPHDASHLADAFSVRTEDIRINVLETTELKN
jgi:hypothetical protein